MSDGYQSCLLLAANIKYGNIIFLVILIFLSAFFSASETALTRVNKVKIKVAADEGSASARKAYAVIDNYDKTLTTLLFGNNLVNIAIATLAVGLFASFMKSQDLVDLVSTLVSTIVVLTFGEIIPKSFANKHSESVTLFIARIIYTLNIILTPFTFLFMVLKNKVFRSKEQTEEKVTENELEVILDNMEEMGELEEEQNDLIQSVLELNDKTVGDIMTPRVDMVAIDVSDDIEKTKKTFFDTKYSRIPVYEDDKDNIIGILYERDFFTKLLKKQKINIKSIMKPVRYVSKEMKVDALIAELQSSKTHIAIVSDEYGGTDGLVTMEDALEELVGEIYDEHDEAEELPLIKISDNQYKLDADLEVEELFDELDLGKAPDTPYNKLGGWLCELAEDIPELGVCINYQDIYSQYDYEKEEYIDYDKTLEFTITEVSERRIKKAILKIIDNKIEENKEESE